MGDGMEKKIQRTEAYKIVCEMTTEDMHEFMIDAFWRMEKKRVVDAVFSVASNEELTEAFRRMGRYERVE